MERVYWREERRKGGSQWELERRENYRRVYWKEEGGLQRGLLEKGEKIREEYIGEKRDNWGGFIVESRAD